MPTTLSHPCEGRSTGTSPEKQLVTRNPKFIILFSLLLFLLAFLPRAIRPVSRPLVWYLRSAHFIEAVLAGDWSNTVYSEHPGVTLMWPSGIGLKLYWMISGIEPAAHTVPPDFEPIHFFEPVPIAEIAAAQMPLALLIALGIVAAYLMLRQLFDEKVAIVAGLLMALSPYQLAQSKILHLDALMSTLMILSALALLVHCRRSDISGGGSSVGATSAVRARPILWLLLSGVLGGMALLVKIPAIFLIPFTALVLLADFIRNSSSVIHHSQFIIRNFLPWLLIAAIVYFALWPVMWVEPGKGLAAVKWGLERHATSAHDTPTLFLGEVTREDPGPLFYVVSLLFRSGEVELTFLAVAAVLGIASLLRRRHSPSSILHSLFSILHSPSSIDYLLLLSYAFFFLAQMCLGAKKMPRYILPALPALDVLAAAGIVTWARRLAGEHRRLALALMALPVLTQAALILPRHPHYGTALNWIAGGPSAAARAILIGEEGEGYADLTAHLNARPDAEELTVAAQLKHVFNQTFRGATVEIDRPADYLAFHRNYTARDYKIGEWKALWERYAARTPEREVSFDGVPYAWLYPKLPPDAQPEHPLSVHFGDDEAPYRLLGHDLRSTDAAPGERVPLVLYWQATEPVTDDLSIFVHLLSPAGELIWQDDGAANHGQRPTWSWAAGEIIADPHTVALPKDLSPGDYRLTVGLYDWQTGERLSASTPAGDQLEIVKLSVYRPRTHPLAWVARGLASLVILSALGAELLSRQRDGATINSKVDEKGGVS